MGADLYDASKKYASRLGKHALAAMGYSLGAKTTEPYQGFLLRASRIDKIYVHDDQVGPFARMVFDGIKVLLKDGVELGSLSTSWKGGDGKMGTVRAIPDFILVPAYHKIRIPFSVIHDEVFSFDTFIENLRNSKVVPLTGRLEWDIYLTTVNDLKKDLFDSKNLDGDYRKGVLLESMPRFMWRATAYNADNLALDLLFDATDIEQGAFFVRAIEYDPGVSQILRAVSGVPGIASMFKTPLGQNIMEWFNNQGKKQT